MWHLIGSAPTTDPRWRKVERWVANASPLVVPVLLKHDDFADVGTALSEHGDVEVSRMTARRRSDLSSVSRGWQARSGSLRPTHHEVIADAEAEGASVRTLSLLVADALSLHLRRLAGATYYTGDFDLFDRLVLGRLATAASRRRDLLSGRARVVDEPPSDVRADASGPTAHREPRQDGLAPAGPSGRPHTALDAALAVPRNAAGYVSRLVHKLRLDKSLFWLRRSAVRLSQPLKAASSALGTTGLLAAATGVVTSPAGRAVLNSPGRMLGKLVGWIARKTYSGIDRVLRCFGRVGNKAADKLFAGVVSLGGRVAAIAAPVVHRVARLSDPATPQARVLSGICQSYVIHKLLKGFISNGWLRLAVELVLVPAVLDSRLWAWTKTAAREARTRAHRLQEQPQVLVDLERQQQAEQPLLVPDDLEDVHVVTTLDEPVPTNRAERRAAQRQGKRPQH